MNTLNLVDLAFPDGDPRGLLGYISLSECELIESLMLKYTKGKLCPLNLYIFQPFGARQIWKKEQKDFLKEFIEDQIRKSKLSKLDLNVTLIIGKIARDEVSGDVLAFWD